MGAFEEHSCIFSLASEGRCPDVPTADEDCLIVSECRKEHLRRFPRKRFSLLEVLSRNAKKRREMREERTRRVVELLMRRKEEWRTARCKAGWGRST